MKEKRTTTIFLCKHCKHVTTKCRVTAIIEHNYTLTINRITGQQQLQADVVNRYVEGLSSTSKVNYDTCICFYCHRPVDILTVDLSVIKKLFRETKTKLGTTLSTSLRVDVIDINKLIPYLGNEIPIEYSALITTLSL